MLQAIHDRMLMVVGFDWERIAGLCSTLRVDWKEACFVSYGRDTSAQNEREAAQIVPLCELARPYGVERVCIQGAAMDITANDASGTRATVLCNALESAFPGRLLSGDRHDRRPLPPYAGGARGRLSRACRDAARPHVVRAQLAPGALLVDIA